MWTPIIGLLLGLMIGGLLPINMPVIDPQMAMILVMSSTDSVLNGFIAQLDSKFNTLLFTVEFLLNTLLGLGVVYFGFIMNIDLLLAVAIIFGVRMFHNISLINQKLFIH